MDALRDSEPPSPAAVRSRPDFVEALRKLKVWAGNPSLADLQRRSGIPRSTLGDALDSSRPGLPRLAVVLAFVQACGCDPDEATQWERAWKAVQTSLDLPATDQDVAAEQASVPTGSVGRGSGLPGDLADFSGRSTEVERLFTVATDGRDQAGRVLIIDGMAGVGKTALAVHVAHRLRAHFPDGCFFLDLNAHTSGQAPVDPAAALELLLRAAGVAPDAVPGSLPERVELWHATNAARRVLVVLDNAASAAQVRPLLPASPGSLCLVTCRSAMLDLDGSKAMSLDVLSPPDAIGLFTQILGDRVANDHDGVAEAVGLCGFLPLAVRLAAARLRARPAWSLDYLVGRLRDKGRRLTELSTPERGVAAAFSMSYQQLGPDQRRMFRLLGLHPGRDIDMHAAAALAGCEAGEAEALLEDLLDDHLLAQVLPGRYTFHDLLRDYAQQAVAAEESDGVRLAAVTRLLDHYRFAAAAAMDVIVPHERHRRPVVTTDTEPLDFVDESAAEGWLAAEWVNLIAAAELATSTGLLAYAPDFSSILWRYLDSESHLPAALALHTRAMHAARDGGDLVGQANAVRHLSAVFWRLTRYDDAIEHFHLALDLSRQGGDQAGERAALTNLGVVYVQAGRFRFAAEILERAFHLYGDCGDGGGQAAAGTNLGIVHERLGSYAVAIDYLQQAHALRVAAGDRAGEGLTLTNLGNVYVMLGRHSQAIEILEKAMAMKSDYGRMAVDDHSLIALARVHLRTGEDQRAFDYLQRAIAFQNATGDHTSEGEALNTLGVYYRLIGHHQEALDHHERALRLARELGDRFLEVEALNEYGFTMRAAGDPAKALDLHQQALDVATESGVRYERARGYHGLAEARHDLGNSTQALDFWQRALGLYVELEVPEADEVRKELAAR